jgi:hypothetical protein
LISVSNVNYRSKRPRPAVMCFGNGMCVRSGAVGFCLGCVGSILGFAVTLVFAGG